MANIKVHLLNFHGLCSHIEIVLENISATPHTFFSMNRWDEVPARIFSESVDTANLIQMASSTYNFEIQANPEELVGKWLEYFFNTKASANVLGNNCAVAAQWFLNKFAGIPNPSINSSKSVQFNHLAFGIFVPSCIPIGVELPGRVMDNAKYYLEKRKNQLNTSCIGIFSNRKGAYLSAVAATAVAGYVATSMSLVK